MAIINRFAQIPARVLGRPLTSLLPVRCTQTGRDMLRGFDSPRKVLKHFSLLRTITTKSPSQAICVDGAGRENRTPVSSLARMHHTTKLYPRTKSDLLTSLCYFNPFLDQCALYDTTIPRFAQAFVFTRSRFSRD